MGISVTAGISLIPTFTLVPNQRRGRKELRMKRAFIFACVALAGSLLIGGCFPIRTGSQAQATDIALGKTLGAATAIAEYKFKSTVEAVITPTETRVNTPTPTAVWYPMGTPISSPTFVPVATNTPSKIPLTSVTTEGRDWIWFQLSSGSLSDTGVGQVKEGITLKVVETSGDVVGLLLSGWVNKDSVKELSDGSGTFLCKYHSEGHFQRKSLCHAHIYGESSLNNIIAIAPPDLKVTIQDRVGDTMKIQLANTIWVGEIYVK